jgi:hypothetical protein
LKGLSTLLEGPLLMREDGPSDTWTREALYELVWSQPMVKLADRFGVSSSYMARVCTLLNVPRPERGYWAKLAVGKAPERPALPAPRLGDALEWVRGGALPRRARTKPQVTAPVTRRRRIARSELPAWHALLRGVKTHFETGRLSYSGGYLKPSKRLLVDLVVTKNGLDKALTFTNDLLLSFQARGYCAVIAPAGERHFRAEVDEREAPGKGHNYNNLWSPMRCTLVYVGTVAYGLTVIEMSEEAEARYVGGEYVRLSGDAGSRGGRYRHDRGWTTTREFPTGRLCLQVYSPYPRVQWTRQWRETQRRELTGRIPAIIRELEAATADIVQLIEASEREAELERQRWEVLREQWRREAEERRIAEALQDSRTELQDIIEDWGVAKSREAFFADAEQRLESLPSDAREQHAARLERARELIGSTDALQRLVSWRTPEER